MGMIDGCENKEVKKFKLDTDVKIKVKEGIVAQKNDERINIIGSSVGSVSNTIRDAVGNEELKKEGGGVKEAECRK